ncbi:hypothetical protein [[Phormidium] sp. ETS-05]|uniref:hypothetical protein n=1 Tax=[Phormidium] sp. ETS-05 TaxID=222819 RepID=UPI0018EF04CB|nr:hypothetical protein [[Phormidium] sp. ETS-05]
MAIAVPSGIIPPIRPKKFGYNISLVTIKIEKTGANVRTKNVIIATVMIPRPGRGNSSRGGKGLNKFECIAQDGEAIEGKINEKDIGSR